MKASSTLWDQVPVVMIGVGGSGLLRREWCVIFLLVWEKQEKKLFLPKSGLESIPMGKQINAANWSGRCARTGGNWWGAGGWCWVSGGRKRWGSARQGGGHGWERLGHVGKQPASCPPSPSGDVGLSFLSEELFFHCLGK